MEDSLIKMLNRKNQLEKSIKKLEKRLEIERFEFDSLSNAIEVNQKYGMAIDESELIHASQAHQTIGDMALEILKQHPDGLTTNNILVKLHEAGMSSIVRSSLSPPLSRLRKKNELELIDNNLWRIPCPVDIPDCISFVDTMDDEIPF